jgi:putative FmdB family regulatory protein
VPTYEYECTGCHRTFEVRQRISEPALTTCEKCGAPVKRLLAPAPFILKGAGWYVTDYPSEARKKAKEAESGTAKAPAATASGDGKSSTASGTDSPSKSTSSSGSGSASSTPSTSSTPKPD